MSTFMDDCNVAVRRLVRAAFGESENYVRPADQTAPAGRQSAPFATVKIISADDRGVPSVTNEHEDPDDKETDLIESVDDHVEFVASVQFWGSTPTPARLRGGAASSDPDDYTGVSAGAFTIPIDGVTRSITGLIFSSVVTMADVADQLEERLQVALPDVTVTWTGERFVIDSPTTGQASAIAPASVTAASSLLALTAAAGAVGGDNRSGIAKPNLEAFDRARRLPMLLARSEFRSLMRRMGLGFQSASIARDLSALAPGGAFEGRGSVDLTFNAVHRSSLPVTPIESVPELGIQVQAPGGEITTIEIEVSQ